LDQQSISGKIASVILRVLMPGYVTSGYIYTTFVMALQPYFFIKKQVTGKLLQKTLELVS